MRPLALHANQGTCDAQRITLSLCDRFCPGVVLGLMSATATLRSLDLVVLAQDIVSNTA